MTATPIDLGLAAPARLGNLTLQPAVRTIRRDDGAEEVVEPRVMQVLLALAEARGDIVRREELTARCWEGRVVGEDAVNRVLSRLRRVAEGIGAGSFRIETVTRVGYRLVELGGQVNAAPVAVAPASKPSRRGLIIGSAAITGAAVVGGGLWWGLSPPAMPAPAREAMERGMAALRFLSVDSLATAIAAFHEAAELAPTSAEPWGKLAFAYRWLYFTGHGQEAALNATRARDAAAKALHLDPNNGDAQAAMATLRPLFENWLAYGNACKPVFVRHPEEIGIGLLYIDFLSNVGDIHTINTLSQRLIAKDAEWPALYSDLVLSSWCLGKLDDADAAMDRAIKAWPRAGGLWFIRQRLLAYSGRAAAALAMIADVDQRPVGLPTWDFDLCAAESQALLTRSQADVDKAAALYWERGRTASGIASNAVQFFAAVGRFDDAFKMIDALYFNRGFSIGLRTFTEEQGTYSERRNRATWMFWLPFMADLRADPRTGAIMKEVGLADYWHKTGTRPDFPIAGIT